MVHSSVFTGIGVCDLAAEMLGWENLFQCENDPFCQKTLKQNFPNAMIHGDIKQTDFSVYKGRVNILTGGFPCQDISISGRGFGIHGQRSGLWSHFARAIEEVNPSFVLIENSSQLLRRGFEQVLYDLSKIGYDAEWECFSAADFGACHKRERLFILAYPAIYRRVGALHYLKRNIIKEDFKTDALDSQRSPFLQFEKRFGEPGVLRVDDGLAKKLDVVKRLGAIGNAIYLPIPLSIFKLINQL